MNIDFYQTAIELLTLDEPPARDVARRYLDCSRRKSILELHAQRCRSQSPYAVAGFSAPLSFAGESDAATLMRAQNLLMNGYPVSLHRDDKNQHVGTPLDFALQTLIDRGEDATIDTVCALYRRHFDWVRNHPTPRIARIPKRLNQLAMTLKHLEPQIAAAVLSRPSPEDPRFSLIVDVDELASHYNDKRKHTILSLKQGRLRINGRNAQAIESAGNGAVSVLTAGLAKAIEKSTGGPIKLVFRKNDWTVQSDVGAIVTYRYWP